MALKKLPPMTVSRDAEAYRHARLWGLTAPAQPRRLAGMAVARNAVRIGICRRPSTAAAPAPADDGPEPS